VTFTAEVSLCLQSDFPAFLPRFCADFLLAQPPAPLAAAPCTVGQCTRRLGTVGEHSILRQCVYRSLSIIVYRSMSEVHGVGDPSILDFVSGKIIVKEI
jgi:hypothetical protein